MSIIEKVQDKLDKEKSLDKDSNILPSLSDVTDDQNDLHDNNIHEDDVNTEEDPVMLGKGIKKHLSKKIDIDLNKLDENGYLTPNTTNKGIFEQLRHMKIKLLPDAFKTNKSGSDYSNLIMITSAIAGEGKTYTSLNLALSIAYEFNRTVLFIDADISKRSSTRLLGLDEYPGLSDYLKNDNQSLSDYLLSTNIKKFNVLPSGFPYEMTTELFSSRKMSELMNELSSRYNDRLIIIDTPPLLQDTSASALALHVNKIIVVIEAEKTPIHIVKKAIRTIKSDKSISIVLNKSNQRYDTGYGSYY